MKKEEMTRQILKFVKVKKFYESKTFWVNVIAIGAILLQSQTGFVATPEMQMAVLAMINIALRAITKEPLDWGLEDIK